MFFYIIATCSYMHSELHRSAMPMKSLSTGCLPVSFISTLLDHDFCCSWYLCHRPLLQHLRDFFPAMGILLWHLGGFSSSVQGVHLSLNLLHAITAGLVMGHTHDTVSTETPTGWTHPFSPKYRTRLAK